MEIGQKRSARWVIWVGVTLFTCFPTLSALAGLLPDWNDASSDKVYSPSSSFSPYTQPTNNTSTPADNKTLQNQNKSSGPHVIPKEKIKPREPIQPRP